MSAAIIMLPIAIGASSAAIVIAIRRGWLLTMAGKVGVACFVLALLVVAFPPPMVDGYRAEAYTALAFLACAVVALAFAPQWTGTAAPRAQSQISGWQAYGQGIDIETGDDDDEEDDWIVVAVDDSDADELHDGGGRTDSGGADRGSGADGTGAPGNAATNGVAHRPAGAGADRHSVRRGRGQRLVGAMVSRQNSGGAGAGGYDAAAASTVASIASAGAASGN